jgi:hypothetical protein
MSRESSGQTSQTGSPDSDISGRDPLQFVILTPGRVGKKWEDEKKAIRDKIAPNATAVLSNPSDGNFEADILRQVKQQVGSTHKTLNQLVLVVHSTPNTIFMHEYVDPHQYIVRDLLDKIYSMQQQLGQPIAKRIVFSGCDLFSEENRNDVNYYREMAHALGAQIVGATSPYFGNKDQVGSMIVFNPDRTVQWDHLSSDPKLVAAEIEATRRSGNLPSDYKPHHNEWLDCHVGKSQELGAACQIGIENQWFAQAEQNERHKISDRLRLSSLGSDGWRQVLGTIEQRGQAVMFGKNLKHEYNALQDSDTPTPESAALAVKEHTKFVTSLSRRSLAALKADVTDYTNSTINPRGDSTKLVWVMPPPPLPDNTKPQASLSAGHTDVASSVAPNHKLLVPAH